MISSADGVASVLSSPGEVSTPRQLSSLPRGVSVVAAVLAHLPLGVLAFRFWPVAAAQALCALMIGLTAAYRKRLAMVAVSCAYIAGAEVLWRMARAPIPYEYGKYAIALICAVAYLRYPGAGRWRWLAMGYLLALVPSTLVLLVDPAVSSARVSDALRFYLAGPLALTATTLVFGGARLSQASIARVLVSVVASTMAIAAAVAYSTLTAAHLSFTNDSNFVTTGDFGPNQVSTALGLGALCALLFAMRPGTYLLARVCAIASASALAGSALMTFSRGGLYGAAGALLCAAPLLLRNKKTRRALVGVGLALAVLAVAVIWPRLDDFTGGMLAQRFADTDPTHRDVLIRDDLLMFVNNPTFGVGPGMSSEHRVLISYGIGHTEYSRMLAEHGIGGGVALLLLAIMALRGLRRRAAPANLGVQVGVLCWSLLTMLHVAMRLSAPSFAFGFALADPVEDDDA